jgi:hypothetical protein
MLTKGARLRFCCPECWCFKKPHNLCQVSWQPSVDEVTNRMRTILLIVLIVLLLGALPTWPYSASWGYYPSGGLGLVLLIVVVLALMGRL